MICSMATAKCTGKIRMPPTKANGKKVNKKAKAHSPMRTAPNTLDNGKITSVTVKAK